MALVGALIGFGLALIGGGLFYSLFDDIIVRYITPYMLVNAGDTFSDLIWDALPYIIVLVGILCLISAGVLHRASKRVIYE